MLRAIVFPIPRDPLSGFNFAIAGGVRTRLLGHWFVLFQVFSLEIEIREDSSLDGRFESSRESTLFVAIG